MQRLVVIAVLLLLLAAALVVLALWLWRRSGLPVGRVIYMDTAAWQRNQRALFSPRYRLTGKPDYLVQLGKRIVPVEVKSGIAPAQPYSGHVLQLAAYCLLVEESFGVPPTHGIIQYADKQFAVPYTPALKAELLRTLDAMRQALAQGNANRSHDEVSRCRACGYRSLCDQRLE